MITNLRNLFLSGVPLSWPHLDNIEGGGGAEGRGHHKTCLVILRSLCTCEVSAVTNYRSRAIGCYFLVQCHDM